MGFNLAFWIGDAPANDAAAAAELERLYQEHLAGDPLPAAPELLAFIGEITARYPGLTDLDDDHIDDGVWSDGPLTDDASGPILYLGVVWSRVDEVVPFLVARARSRGLNVFDPQETRRLL